MGRGKVMTFPTRQTVQEARGFFFFRNEQETGEMTRDVRAMHREADGKLSPLQRCDRNTLHASQQSPPR